MCCENGAGDRDVIFSHWSGRIPSRAYPLQSVSYLSFERHESNEACLTLIDEKR
jgi:hypothetical protein